MYIEMLARLRPSPMTRDNVGDFQGGRVVPNRLLIKAPSVMLPVGHLSRLQLVEFAQLLAISQSITQGFRPLLLCNSQQIETLRQFGWVLEVHPTEEEWIRADAYGDWLDSVAHQATLALRRYAINRVLAVDATDCYETAIQGLSGLTGLDLRRLVPRDPSLLRQREAVVGYRTWMAPGVFGALRRVEFEGSSRTVVWRHRGGTGTLLADADGVGLEVLADELGWSSIVVEGLADLGGAAVAALCHLSGPTRPSVVATLGLPTALGQDVQRTSGTPVLSLDHAELDTPNGVHRFALDLTRMSAKRVFAGVTRSWE